MRPQYKSSELPVHQVLPLHCCGIMLRWKKRSTISLSRRQQQKEPQSHVNPRHHCRFDPQSHDHKKNASRNKKNESCLLVKFDIRLHLVRLRVKPAMTYRGWHDNPFLSPTIQHLFSEIYCKYLFHCKYLLF